MEAGVEAGADEGVEAGVNAGVEAGVEAGGEARVEAGAEVVPPKKASALQALNVHLGIPAPFDPPTCPSLDRKNTKELQSKIINIKFSKGKSPKERKALVKKLLMNLLENEEEEGEEDGVDDDGSEDEGDWDGDGGGDDAQR
jgi:hypothetical protein